MIELSKIIIEKDVPIPQGKKQRLKYGNYADVIKKLNVGDSFVINDEIEKEIFRTTSYQVKPRVKICSRKMADNEWRIWRIE